MLLLVLSLDAAAPVVSKLFRPSSNASVAGPEGSVSVDYTDVAALATWSSRPVLVVIVKSCCVLVGVPMLAIIVTVSTSISRIHHWHEIQKQERFRPCGHRGNILGGENMFAYPKRSYDVS